MRGQKHSNPTFSIKMRHLGTDQAGDGERWPVDPAHKEPPKDDPVERSI